MSTAQTRSKQEKQSVRNRLLNTASRLFYEEGINTVGIDRILDEAGAAKASLYHHFGSKDGLIEAYLGQKAAAFETHVDEVIRDDPNQPKQALLALFRDACSYSTDPQFRGCPLQLAIAELSGCDHAACAIIDEQRTSFRNLLTDLCKRAGAADPDMAGSALYMLYQGILSANATDSGESNGAAQWAARQIINTM